MQVQLGACPGSTLPPPRYRGACHRRFSLFRDNYPSRRSRCHAFHIFKARKWIGDLFFLGMFLAALSPKRRFAYSANVSTTVISWFPLDPARRASFKMPSPSATSPLTLSFPTYSVNPPSITDLPCPALNASPILFKQKPNFLF